MIVGTGSTQRYIPQPASQIKTAVSKISWSEEHCE
jgi:hypothetical protein